MLRAQAVRPSFVRNASLVFGNIVFGIAFALYAAFWILHNFGSFVMPSNITQLLLLMLRRGFTRKERIRCWQLLRRVRKGKSITQSEFDELRRFARIGLLHNSKRQRAYNIAPDGERGLRFWDDDFVVRQT